MDSANPTESSASSRQNGSDGSNYSSSEYLPLTLVSHVPAWLDSIPVAACLAYRSPKIHVHHNKAETSGTRSIEYFLVACPRCGVPLPLALPTSRFLMSFLPTRLSLAVQPACIDAFKMVDLNPVPFDFSPFLSVEWVRPQACIHIFKESFASGLVSYLNGDFCSTVRKLDEYIDQRVASSPARKGRFRDKLACAYWYKHLAQRELDDRAGCQQSLLKCMEYLPSGLGSLGLMVHWNKSLLVDGKAREFELREVQRFRKILFPGFNGSCILCGE